MMPVRQWWRDRSLRSKAWLVVAVPAVALFTCLLAQARIDTAWDDYTRELDRSTSYQRAVSGVQVEAHSMEQSAWSRQKTGDDQFGGRFAASRDEMARQLDQLDSLAAGMPGREATARAIRVGAGDVEKNASSLITMQHTPESESKALELGASLTAADNAIDDTTLAALSAESRNVTDLEQAQQSAAHTAGAQLQLVTAASVLATALAMGLFTSGVIRRLRVLGDDTGEIEHGGSMPARPARNDEIGELRARFEHASQLLVERDQQLAESKLFLEGVITAAPVVVFAATIVDEPSWEADRLPWRPYYTSPNIGRMLGEDETSVDWSYRMPAGVKADDRKAFIARRQQAIRERRETFSDTYHYVLPGGEVRCFQFSAQFFHDDPKGPRLLGYTVDVTEAHRALERMRDSEARLQTILDNSTALISLKDRDGSYMLVNDAFAALAGLPAARVEGRTDEDLWPGSAPAERRADAEVLATSRPVRVEQRIETLAGPRDFLSVKSRLTGTDGTPYAVCTVATDITELRAATHVLQGAMEAAERASLAKSEFLSRMSHELRTPLNSILGFAQLLAGDALGDKQSSYVDQVLIAGRHLLDLINDVLDVSRIESGGLVLSIEPIDIAGVVANVVTLTKSAAVEGAVTVTVEGGPATKVLADRQRLVQVIVNLTTNAIKYNHSGGSVRITWRDDGDRVAISVADDGVGIAPQNLDRLFTPFDRLGAENTAIEGTGVGLALSKSLTEAMSGSMQVESDVGLGSTFTVMMPSASTADEGRSLPPPAGAAGGSAPGAEASHHIVCIEDNPSNMTLIELYATSRPGIRFEGAATGTAGLQLIEQDAPDLVLLDLNLPDMDGADLIRSLRGGGATADLPVIVLTADATDERRDEVLAAGATAYLTKPVDLFELQLEIDRVASFRATPSL